MEKTDLEKTQMALGYVTARHQRLEMAARQVFEHPYKPVALDFLYKTLMNDPRAIPPLAEKDRTFIEEVLSRSTPASAEGATQAEKDLGT